MNNQFLMNKRITVQYAFKKEGKGERHGTAAERLFAAKARRNNVLHQCTTLQHPWARSVHGRPFQASKDRTRARSQVH